MAIDRARLRSHLVCLEATEARCQRPDPEGYRRSAQALRLAVQRDFSGVPMKSFMHPELRALETIAQNVFFESRGRFADLDGSGSALRARELGEALLERLAAAGRSPLR